MCSARQTMTPLRTHQQSNLSSDVGIAVTEAKMIWCSRMAHHLAAVFAPLVAGLMSASATRCQNYPANKRLEPRRQGCHSGAANPPLLISARKLTLVAAHTLLSARTSRKEGTSSTSRKKSMSSNQIQFTIRKESMNDITTLLHSDLPETLLSCLHLH
jgi:hypothetical protein